jgi:hypothetical protein
LKNEFHSIKEVAELGFNPDLWGSKPFPLKTQFNSGGLALGKSYNRGAYAHERDHHPL